MKVTINENNEITLTQLYNPITLSNNSNKELIHICERDNGFEFSYNNKMYEAKDGNLTILSNCIKQCGMNYCDEHGCVHNKEILKEPNLNEPKEKHNNN